MMQKLLEKVSTLEPEAAVALYNMLLAFTEDNAEPIEKPEPPDKNRYSQNQTMRLIGYQYIPDSERIKSGIEDIVTAYRLEDMVFKNKYNLYSYTLDIFNFGLIEGKRSLRAKKKATTQTTK